MVPLVQMVLMSEKLMETEREKRRGLAYGLKEHKPRRAGSLALFAWVRGSRVPARKECSG